MKKFSRRLSFWSIVLSVLVALAGAVHAEADEITISMAFLPGILETPDSGPFVDLIKEMDDAYPGTIKRGVFPFPRSIDNVLTGKADFHLPMIRNKLVAESSLPYAYSTAKMGDVVFVIYSNKANPITVEKIKQAKSGGSFPLKIETSGGFEDYFDFPIKAALAVDSALKKVNLKRIDAFIFAMEECDHVIEQLKLSNVHRELYDKFDDVFLIPKGAAGKKIDGILSECLAKMKADGSLKDLHGKVHQDYQP